MFRINEVYSEKRRRRIAWRNLKDCVIWRRTDVQNKRSLFDFDKIQVIVKFTFLCYKLNMKVAIFFGSASDKDTMKKATDVLKEFDVDYNGWIISAHRAGELLSKTVKQVENDGYEVIIAGAGLAAALPGVIAGMTTIPVIGVPLECVSEKSNGLAGMDALLSIVQMPPQIPVATVGIENAKNAAYLAIEILAIKYPELKTKLIDFRKKLSENVEKSAEIGKSF